MCPLHNLQPITRFFDCFNELLLGLFAAAAPCSAALGASKGPTACALQITPSINQLKREISYANDQTNPGHQHKAPDQTAQTERERRAMSQ